MPAQLQACIFSFDEGTQSWAKLLSLLGELRGKGFHCAIVTNASRADFERKMASRKAVLEAMDAIVTGNEVDRPKPAPDLFVEAARRLRVDPTRCLVFDESPAGVAGAQTAGMLSAAVGPRVAERFAALAPDWLLRDISAFDPRDIALPRKAVKPVKPAGADGGAADGEEPPMVAFARMLPPGSALQRCLMGNRGAGGGGYSGLGV